MKKYPGLIERIALVVVIIIAIILISYNIKSGLTDLMIWISGK